MKEENKPREDRVSLDFSSWAHEKMRQGSLTERIKAGDVLMKGSCFSLIDDAIGTDAIRREVARQAIARMYELAGLGGEYSNEH
jgi:hypothetical protein